MRNEYSRHMKVGMSQSNYLPWRGYFDLIKRSDLFLFYDDVQYTKQDWRNRNKIKTADGLKWITIPVKRGNDMLKIQDMVPDGQQWRRKHLAMIESNYSRAPYFDQYIGFFRQFYSMEWETLSELNQYLIRNICRMLGISTTFGSVTDYPAEGTKGERVLNILKKVGCTTYNFGPAGKAYLSDEDFEKNGMSVHWMEYDYAEYPQLHPPFEGAVSIIDLLFNTGAAAKGYI